MGTERLLARLRRTRSSPCSRSAGRSQRLSESVAQNAAELAESANSGVVGVTRSRRPFQSDVGVPIQTAPQRAAISWSRDFQRTAACVLTVCELALSVVTAFRMKPATLSGCDTMGTWLLPLAFVNVRTEEGSQRLIPRKSGGIAAGRPSLTH